MLNCLAYSGLIWSIVTMMTLVGLAANARRPR